MKQIFLGIVAPASALLPLFISFVYFRFLNKECKILTFYFIITLSANAVNYCGAKSVFVDADPYTWNIDINKIESNITEKTKAIMPVHLYGNPCEMQAIRKIADKHRLFVVEDAAEAHGASFDNKKVGSLSDISCFSFFANKIITTGEGGMCLTNNPQLADRLKLLRDHGMSKDKKYWHEVVGFNYRMTNLQAAVGLAQLERINEFIDNKIIEIID